MNEDSMRSVPVRIRMWMRVPRRVAPLVVAASFVAVMSGCAGDGGQREQPEDVRPLAGVTADHGLDPGSRISVEPGTAEDRGSVTIHCPADMPACEVVVGADGSVGYDPAGGVPAIVPLSPAPDSVGDLLRRRLYDSTWPVAASFGGGIATCDAVGCPVPDAIHVDRPAAGGTRRPSDDHRPDLSGFELLEPRRSVAVASKARPASEGQRSASHRAFGAWMDHGFFLVERHGDAGFGHYETIWFGDASHSGPLTSPGDTATWSGVMSGVDTSPSGGPGAFVHGDSAIVVSGLAAGADIAVDVAFTNIVNEDTGAGVADIVWRGLPLQGREFGTDDVLFDGGAGYFRDESFGAAARGSLYGRFYGAGHEEVGGLFRRDGIAGAFAGKRDR